MGNLNQSYRDWLEQEADAARQERQQEQADRFREGQQQIADMRSRAQHGLPLTIAQQRWLVEKVTGPLPPKRARCTHCGDDGCDECTHKEQVSPCHDIREVEHDE